SLCIAAIDLSVIVLSARNRCAVRTFFASPFQRHFSTSAVHANRCNSAVAIPSVCSSPLACRCSEEFCSPAVGPSARATPAEIAPLPNTTPVGLLGMPARPRLPASAPSGLRTVRAHRALCQCLGPTPLRHSFRFCDLSLVIQSGHHQNLRPQSPDQLGR